MVAWTLVGDDEKRRICVVIFVGDHGVEVIGPYVLKRLFVLGCVRKRFVAIVLTRESLFWTRDDQILKIFGKDCSRETMLAF